MSNHKIIFLIFFFLISYTYQKYTAGENFCTTCDSKEQMCTKCESEVFKPDTKGGCEGAKKCRQNDNHCIKCSDTSYICEICEDNYYRDNNGGCSNSQNCEISEDGICKKCEDNYVFIYKGNFYLECVSLDSEELRNCEEYDIYGHCLQCKDNFYMNVGDQKCSNTKNCSYSTNGLCDKCEIDFYLDKSYVTNYLCLSNTNETNNFYKCVTSEDGINCTDCLTQYFVSSGNHFCVKSKYCKTGMKIGLGRCSVCNDNYFLSQDGFSCTLTDNCKTGYGYNEKCKICKDGYYINLTDGYCYSNQEDNEQKYCVEFLEKCEQCVDKYYIGEDLKCSSTLNCSESYLGNCTKCIDNYYLGKLDHKCTTVELCSKSDENYVCEECDDGYFLYGTEKCISDDEHGGKYKNCKKVSDKTEICTECKTNFYLDKTDDKCYDNTKDVFPKCSIVIKNSEGKKECNACESPYYLGDEDLKCTLVQYCAISSEDAKTCLKCQPSTCLNRFLNLCLINYNLYDEEGSEICYNCIETSNDGNKCEKCDEGFIVSNKGFCIDRSTCAKLEGDNCIECKQDVDEAFNLHGISYCLNYQYECLRSLLGCLKCDNFFNPGNCTECFKGYYLDQEFNSCYFCKEGCNSCTNKTNCGECEEEGYYIVKEASSEDSYDAICNPCVDGCKVCTNDLECEICFKGYFLNNKNIENRMKCNRCSASCEECFDETYCTKCEEGYQLVLSEDRFICVYNNTGN